MDLPNNVPKNPAMEATMTMPPMTRFRIQMPRRLNRVRTLLTKYVIQNHHVMAPVKMAR